MGHQQTERPGFGRRDSRETVHNIALLITSAICMVVLMAVEFGLMGVR